MQNFFFILLEKKKYFLCLRKFLSFLLIARQIEMNDSFPIYIFISYLMNYAYKNNGELISSFNN